MPIVEIVAVAVAGALLVAATSGKAILSGIWTFLKGAWAQIVPLGVLFIAAVGVWVLVRAARADGHHRDVWAQWIALVALAGVTLALYATGPRWSRSPEEGAAEPASRSYFATLAVGKDGRWSTSKVQALLWTYAILYALTALFVAAKLGLPLDDGNGKKDGFGDLAFQPEYLILLGGPFASAVLAKGIINAKVENGSIVKPEVGDDHTTADGFRDLISSDDERVDLVDFQYFMFNLLALAVFLGSLVPHLSQGLPELPDFLFALTSASALTYVARKAVERSVPSIVSVTPDPVFPGQTLTVTGHNLAGATGASGDVVLAGRRIEDAEVDGAGEEAKLKLRVPADLPAGADRSLSVSPAGSVAEATATVTIAGVAITGATPAPFAVTPGATLTVTGSGFGPAPGEAFLGDPAVPASKLRVIAWTDAQLVLAVGDGAAGPAADETRPLTVRRPPPAADAAPASLTGTWALAVAARTATAITAVSPETPALVPGAPIVVTGTGFGTATGAVRLGAVRLNVTAWTDTRITATIPAPGDGVDAAELSRGDTLLTVEPAGGGTGVPWTLTVAGVSIAAVEPAPLPPAAGTALRVTGTGFGTTPAQRAKLEVEGVVVKPVSWSDTLVTATLPDGITAVGGHVDVRVTHALGHSGSFSVAAADRP